MELSRLWRSLVLAGALLGLSPQMALATPSAPSSRLTVLKARFGEQIHADLSRLHAGQPHLRALRQLKVPTQGQTSEDRARFFIAQHADLLDLQRVSLRPLERQNLPTGEVVRFALDYQGIPVEAQSVVVRLDRDGQVRSFTSDALPFTLPSIQPKLTAAQALEAVKTQRDYAFVGKANLRVLVSAPHLAQLAWKVNVAHLPFQSHFDVWVDAETGAILNERPAGFAQPRHRHHH